jgi:hypothetical protein
MWLQYLSLVLSEECMQLYSHSPIYIVTRALITCMHLPVTTFWWNQRILRLQCGFVLSGCIDYVAVNN